MKLDNSSEYNTPEIYDAEYGKWTGDFSIFVGLVKTGLALDLACGTGRLTIALAQSGLAVTGIDVAPKMLNLAAKKSTGLNISYIAEDVRRFQFDKKFDLITMAGNSFQALLNDNDQNQVFKTVRAHLKPGGIFVFNTRNPTLDELRTTKAFEFWHDFIDPEGNAVNVYGKQFYHSSKNIVFYTTKRVWEKHETLTDVALRFTDKQTLENRLAAHKLELLNVYGDYDKSSFTEHSKNLIFVCRNPL